MAEPAATGRRGLLAAVGAAAATLAGCGTAGGPDGGPSPTTSSPSTDRQVGPLALEPVATGFRAPVDLASPAVDGPRYVADQTGVVSAVGPDGTVADFLDLRDRVVTGGERGLLGLALHPAFEENRRFYVRYSAPPRPGTPSGFDHTFVLSEFRADNGGRHAVAGSERALLEIPEPQSNHNAGSIAFGPEGYLYVGVGDGGAGGDVGLGHADDWYRGNRGGNGQDVTDNLLGSVLRIDVDGEATERPYGIPEDNPLVGEAGLDEHFAWGFRNPWRLSFDGEDCYVGDVGQNAYEEVDRLARGGNFGWNVKEGTHCYGADGCPNETPEGEALIDPVIEYPHGGGPVSGLSVIGGYVYRGDAIPGLGGTYVFGDLDSRGRLFVAQPAEGDGLWPTGTLPIAEADRSKLSRLLSFGRDPSEELYVLGTGEDGGGVYALRPAG